MWHGFVPDLRGPFSDVIFFFFLILSFLFSKSKRTELEFVSLYLSRLLIRQALVEDEPARRHGPRSQTFFPLGETEFDPHVSDEILRVEVVRADAGGLGVDGVLPAASGHPQLSQLRVLWEPEIAHRLLLVSRRVITVAADGDAASFTA